jgi:hypothetical protein
MVLSSKQLWKRMRYARVAIPDDRSVIESHPALVEFRRQIQNILPTLENIWEEYCIPRQGKPYFSAMDMPLTVQEVLQSQGRSISRSC